MEELWGDPKSEKQGLRLPRAGPHSLVTDAGHRCTGYVLQGVRELGASDQRGFLEKMALGLEE